MTGRYTATGALRGLKDFQRASVDHAFHRLFDALDSTKRFLVADETGLGKTMVAKGVIAKTIERLQDDDSVHRIDIIYVCSNTDIADQNLAKLNPGFEGHSSAPATRLTLLIEQRDLLSPTPVAGHKPVTFVSFTPGTSFELGHQTGRRRERAILHVLLSDRLGLTGWDERALTTIMRRTVKVERFDEAVKELRRQVEDADGGYWEPAILKTFSRDLGRSGILKKVRLLIDEVGRRRELTDDQRTEAIVLISRLRQMLARASVEALEPDLIVLDEFQRFRSLLQPGNEAADLAHHLFGQESARVLLLSATPYKPFTFAEESASGDDHYADLFATLSFLGGDEVVVQQIREDLSTYRDLVLAGAETSAVRQQLRDSMCRLMSRTERPSGGASRTDVVGADDVTGVDIAGFAALHHLARHLDAPLTVEYWKAAPYLVNFIDSYKVGHELQERLADPVEREVLQPLLDATQRLEPARLKRRAPVEWGNARMRRLAEDTVDAEWWKALWMPPSLPYHEPEGAFARLDRTRMTKRLVFSSWVAAPTAIASLMSYEVQRRILQKTDRLRATTEFRSRLSLRLDTDGSSPANMTALALFWPMPKLAQVTDPLLFARLDSSSVRTVADLHSWSRERAASVVGPDGSATTSASSLWSWRAPIALGSGPVAAEALMHAGAAVLAEAIDGGGSSELGDSGLSDVEETSSALSVHVETALSALVGTDPDIERPTDLVATAALLGTSSPANVCWRALWRLIPEGSDVSSLGHWRAAAVLASGFRRLFGREDTTALLDAQSGAEDEPYWRQVLHYCRAGDLQAVMDEYLFHLANSSGADVSTDGGLMGLAREARRSIALTGVNYQATHHGRTARLDEKMRLPGRFALRYGGIRQQQDDARLPEVRAAFNSPFWPFVLATTSIGQEGIDLHWWCHSIVHWNLPANPVDFEQREGRVNRFMGHAVRKNVASRHRGAALDDVSAHPWDAAFAAATADRSASHNEMYPYWMCDGPAQVERVVPSFPLSRDQSAWVRMQELTALYRLAYGQPRQDVMVEILRRRGVDAARAETERLDLSPPPPPVA